MHTLTRVKNAYTFMTICLIVVGAVLLLWPRLGFLTMCKISGVILICYGMTKLAGYFAKDLFQLAFQYDLALGIVLIVLGVIIVAKTEYIMYTIPTVVGICILIDAALKIQTAIEAKKFGIERWKFILIMALLTAIVGVLLLVMSRETMDMLVRVIGINLMLDGILNLFVVRNTVETIRRNREWEI